MKKRAVFLFIICLASVFMVPFSLNTAKVMADDGYLDFSQIANKQLPFSYGGITAIGGGSGYGGIVTSGDTTVSAYDENNNLKTPSQLYSELVSKISQASNGDVIYIDPRCTIDFPATVEINKPLTIASNRGSGNFNGALLRSSTLTAYDYLFNITSNDVRITGLRFRGNKDSNLLARAICAYDRTDANGSIIPISNIEIDNCDFSYWIDAINVQQTSDTNVLLDKNAFKIHHNYIHQNNLPNACSDRGYGIMVDNAYASIYANIFHNNRHDIAGTGHDKSGYEAYCNIILEGDSTQSNFDMHADRIYNSDGTYVMEYHAGGFMHIHHNDFRDINPQANIYPVGKPKTLCMVDNNSFAANSVFGNGGSCAITQTAWGRTNSPDGYGNIVAVNNIYGSSYLGWYVRQDWVKGRTDNFIRIPSTNDLLLSAVGATLSGSWISTSPQYLDYYPGDFNGDGVTDIFKTDGNSWYYLPLTTDYTDHWNPLVSSDYKIGTMALQSGSSDVYNYTPTMIFGNFDSNSTTDVLITTGSEWDVSYGAVTSWTGLQTSGLTAGQLLFGRFSNSGFNNDITDAFYTNGTWSICYDGLSWRNVNSSTYSNLKLGDFNGDGYSDVFCSTGSNWQYSSNATSSWINLKSSGIGAGSIVLGDFNGDNRSDVICIYNNNWWVATSGTSDLIDLTTANFPLGSFVYGDFN